jgi:molybdate transport system ATP-binding protein
MVNNMLTVSLEKQLGALSLDVAFDNSGGVTALFGASGTGKTSIINMIAGLLTPDRGRIVLDGRTLFDTKERVNMPAWKRGVGVVFQEGRLFPHLSVKHNLDFGRWMRGHTADPKDFAHVVALLDIGHLLARRPGKLSGGERQRVAFGRALLMKPRLLLLDEPLASLDAARKQEILPYLERLRDDARVPMIYVSHDPAEVKRIATRVVKLEAGRVAAEGGVELL